MSTFQIEDTIIYPVYGAGKIKKVTTEKINNEHKEYYEVELFTTQISISIPKEEAETLGMRYPINKKSLISALANLGKKKKLTEDLINTLDSKSKQVLKNGTIDDMVDLINILNAKAASKESQNKKLSYSENKYLNMALNFIKSEVQLVLGEDSLKKYGLHNFRIMA